MVLKIKDPGNHENSPNVNVLGKQILNVFIETVLQNFYTKTIVGLTYTATAICKILIYDKEDLVSWEPF